MYRFNAISIKIAANYFVDIDKLILKFIWRGKRPRVANTILKKNRIGKHTGTSLVVQLLLDQNPPSNAGDAGSIPGQGTKIPHAVGQLSPHATNTGLACFN